MRGQTDCAVLRVVFVSLRLLREYERVAVTEHWNIINWRKSGPECDRVFLFTLPAA